MTTGPTGRMTDAEYQRAEDWGGPLAPELAREARRARKAEAIAVAALEAVAERYCPGSAQHHKMAAAALAAWRKLGKQG